MAKIGRPLKKPMVKTADIKWIPVRIERNAPLSAYTAVVARTLKEGHIQLSISGEKFLIWCFPERPEYRAKHKDADHCEYQAIAPELAAKMIYDAVHGL